MLLAMWFGVGQTRACHRHVEDVKHIDDELVSLNRQKLAELRGIRAELAADGHGGGIRQRAAS